MQGMPPALLALMEKMMAAKQSKPWEDPALAPPDIQRFNPGTGPTNLPSAPVPPTGPVDDPMNLADELKRRLGMIAEKVGGWSR